MVISIQEPLSREIGTPFIVGTLRGGATSNLTYSDWSDLCESLGVRDTMAGQGYLVLCSGLSRNLNTRQMHRHPMYIDPLGIDISPKAPRIKGGGREKIRCD